MRRNEQELLDSLLTMVGGAKTPTPLTNSELAEIEKFRDDKGIIDLTGLKDMNVLRHLVDLVDRKNQIEEVETGKSTQEYISDLVQDLLPIMGLNGAKLNISTPSGSASVEVEKGKKPVVEYNDKTSRTESTTNNCSDWDLEKETIKPGEIILPQELTNAILTCYNDRVNEKANKTSEDMTGVACTEKNVKTEEDDGLAVQLISAGGMHNPEFYNAVHYICENKHFPEYGVYTENETTPDRIDTYVLLPNAFNKMLEHRVEEFYNKMLDETALISVYVIDPETFELTEILSAEELWDYAMTEAQEYSLR